MNQRAEQVRRILPQQIIGSTESRIVGLAAAVDSCTRALQEHAAAFIATACVDRC